MRHYYWMRSKRSCATDFCYECARNVHGRSCGCFYSDYGGGCSAEHGRDTGTSSGAFLKQAPRAMGGLRSTFGDFLCVLGVQAGRTLGLADSMVWDNHVMDRSAHRL